VFAKIIGVVTAIIIFFLYFKWRGADPVLETMFGILLALIGGYWAWWVMVRRNSLNQEEGRAKRRTDGAPPA
jgi:nicotinamide riboside transporter PnuC